MRMTKHQRERDAWTRFVDGEKPKAPGICSGCGQHIPRERLAKNLKTCSVACGKIARTAKYGGELVTFNGKEYASKREANVAMKLQALERGGIIRDLKEQVRIVLVEGEPGTAAVTYWADFTYYDQENRLHVIDAKGMKTAVYKLKKRLAKLLLKIEIEEE